MKILFVYAHPSPHSLNATLKTYAIAVLEREGHELQVSDLYAMKWKAVADAEDFPERDSSLPLEYMTASGEAYENGTQAKDIAAEQEKLRWADAVVFQFPVWWFGLPAILKGWVDRVFAFKFAYGYKNAGNAYRYGEGVMEGKRALLSVTAGGPEIDYGARGINGPLEQLLFPITHGTLFFPGMDVLPTFAVYDTSKMDEAAVEAAKQPWNSDWFACSWMIRFLSGGKIKEAIPTSTPSLPTSSQGLPGYRFISRRGWEAPQRKIAELPPGLEPLGTLLIFLAKARQNKPSPATCGYYSLAVNKK
jgi:NAD(P)H dehydrogenase (quinone)